MPLQPVPSVSNGEARLCLGSHRQPLSSRSSLDTSLFPAGTPSTPEDGRDVRVRLLAEVFNATAEGLNVKYVSQSELESAHKALNASLDELDGLSRVILPMSGRSQSFCARN